MAILTLDALLAVDDRQTETIVMPEWGGEVVIQSITKAQQNEIRRACRNGDEFDNELFGVLMVIAGMKEPRLTRAHAEALLAKNAGLVERLLQRILELSALTQEGLTAKKAVDTAEAAFRQ